MTVFYPLIIPMALGFLIALNLTKASTLPSKTAFCIILSGPLGLGCVSVILFVSFVFGNIHANLISLFISSSLSAALLIAVMLPRVHHLSAYSNKPITDPRFSFRLIAWVAAFSFFCLMSYELYRYLDYFFNYASWNLRGGWDARCLWNLKARFLFRDPEEWYRMFSPVLGYSLPDYPLLLPASIAWGWIFSEKELLLWPFIVSLVFFLSSFGLSIWYIASYRSKWLAFLAGAFLLTVPAYRFWSTALYADIPLAFFVTSATLVLLIALRSRERNLFFLSGLLAGLSSWTKNEGLPFLAIIFSLLAIIILTRLTKERKFSVSLLLCWLGGVLIPLAASLYLKCFLGGGGVYLGSQRTLFQYLAVLTDTERMRFILACLAILKSRWLDWNALWILFLVSAALSFIFPHRCRAVPYRWLPLAMILLIESLYVLVYMITPIDIGFHIQTSMQRLFLHTGILALVFTFDTFGCLAALPPESPSSTSPESQNE